MESLKNNPVDYNPKNREIDRIIQFYRLLLLMGIDQNKDQKEVNLCKEMGLNPIAINTSLERILNSKTGTLPPQEVIKIFQVNHN